MGRITRQKQTKYLEFLGRNAKGALKEKVQNIINLYSAGKITQIQTAENIIFKLTSKDGRILKAGLKQYDKKIDLYQKQEPLRERLQAKQTEKIKQIKASIIGKAIKSYNTRRKMLLKNTETKNLDKPLTTIIFNLNTKEAFPNMPDPPDKEEILNNYDFELGREPHQDTIFDNIKDKLYFIILRKLKTLLDNKKAMKVSLGVTFKIFKEDYSEPATEEEEPKIIGKPYKQDTRISKTKAISVNSSNINNVTSELIKKLSDLATNFNTEESKWRVKKYYNVFIEAFTTKVPRGSSYIPTPEPYNHNKCGLINIQNNDLECFKWCLRYHQTKKDKHDDRISVLSKIKDKYDYSGFEFPFDFDDINRFEEINKVCIFVFYIDEENKIIKERDGNHNYVCNDLIYLLRIENKLTSHYVYIKHISRLLNLTTHIEDKDKRYCPYCNTKVQCHKFDNHIATCYKIQKEGSILKLPPPGSFMSFKNHKNQIKRPFIVYADCECRLDKTTDPNKIQEHNVNSCCYYFVTSFDDTRNHIKTFVGDTCMRELLPALLDLAYSCIDEMQNNERMTMTKQDNINFKNATSCYICNEELNEKIPKLKKVKDHDHKTGKYIGAAHACCNINYFSNRYLPVVFHNLRGYDGHLIIKEAHALGIPNIGAIPNSNEKLMSLNIGPLKFIDSFQFMASSIEQLTLNLYQPGGDKYKYFNSMKKEFPEHMDKLCRKGYYPYEWLDDNEKFNYIGLPPKEKFYSTLTQKNISDEEYKHACSVYEALGCKSFLDYHLAYLKCDVLLLSDIFENFRNTCLSNYNLDPANYISAPSLAWDAMLLKTGVKLEQISDIKILDIIERQKRGGLCFVGSKRYVQANNRYTETFNKDLPENYIIYLDANNLYGWAMSEALPYKDIKFSNETTLENILKTEDEGDTGYILEVDLLFPEELHDKFKQFPPCPENIAPCDDWLSDYQKEIAKKNNIKTTSCKKLIPHLYEHKNYCIHYRNLKFVHELGVKINKIHNIISFKQAKWLKPYIDFNTQKRKEAKNDFEKDFFKLLNNAVFGKTMENVKNRIELHITSDNDNAIKWFSKPTLKTCKETFGLYLIEMYKSEVILDKPIYIGTSILDLSKICMMDFHYNVIQKEFPDNHNLIYDDTDSLVYEIITPDLYDWIRKNKNYFDLSDSLMPDLKDDTNKKVIGKFKDEMNSLIITDFIALNPKVYSINYIKKNEITNKKTLKGISKTVVKNEITHDNYINVLKENTTIKKNVISIRSFSHQIYTYKQNKVALTSYYDKMELQDSINCVPFGYKK